MCQHFYLFVKADYLNETSLDHASSSPE